MDAQASAVFATSGVFGNTLRSIGAASGTLVGASTATGVVTFSSQSTMIAVGVAADVQAGALDFDGTGSASFVGDWTDFETAVLSSAGTGVISLAAESVAAAAYDIDTSGAATLVGADASTTLLLNNFNDSDGVTTLTDEISTISWTRPFGGGGEIDTGRSKFGGSSLMCVGTDSAWLRGSTFASPNVGDYTAQVWFNTSSTDASASCFLVETGVEGNGVEFGIYLVDSTWTWFLNVYDSSGSTVFEVSGTPTISVDTWYHLAMCRDSSAGKYELFFNGNRLTSQSSATNARAFDGFDLLGPGTASTTWYDDAKLSTLVEYSGATYSVPTSEATA